MAKHNPMTESKYKAIKMLLNGGAMYKEAAEYMGVSEVTVYRVKASENFTEYVNMMEEKTLAARKERQAKRNAQEQEQQTKTEEKTPEVVKEVRQTVTIQATHYMMQEMQKTNELLTLISNKLAFIVDELCGTGKK